MKIKSKSLLPAGTIINHNGELLEIGEYSSHRGVYQMYTTEKEDNMPVYKPIKELTKSDLLNDEIEHLPDLRVAIKTYPTKIEIFINLWDTIDFTYNKHINTDNIEIEDGFNAAEHADIDVENILSDLTEPLYAGFELTDEEIEFLKSELTFYYNVYRR